MSQGDDLFEFQLRRWTRGLPKIMRLKSGNFAILTPLQDLYAIASLEDLPKTLKRYENTENYERFQENPPPPSENLGGIKINI